MAKVYVRDNNIDEALRIFKRAVKQDGILQNCKDREFFLSKREKQIQKQKNRKGK